MSADRIKTLLELMDAHGVAELDLEEGDFKLKLRKAGAAAPAAAAPAPAVYAAPAPAVQQVTALAPVAAAAAPAAKPVELGSDLVPIKSPIVGTFYRASSPDSDPFVAEGSRVAKDTVVCIVDAMKIMNEIKAGVAGTIAKVLVENGEPVEYDQPLFLVKP